MLLDIEARTGDTDGAVLVNTWVNPVCRNKRDSESLD